MVEYFVGPDEEPDRYRLIEPHAGGGESEVWRAEVTVGDVGLPVAVKVLRPDLGDADRWRQRWRDQVELLRSLGRPGIVTVREGFEGARLHTAGDAATVDQRALYLVMEWVEGPSLHEWATVREVGRDRTQGLKMVWQVGAAVDYLHSGQMTSGRAVLHRDIKPSNVIVTDRGAILVDFGLVKMWDHGPGSLVGTPGFRAPEVAVDGVHTPASDRFAVGAVAYFVITGQAPTTDLEAARQRLAASLSDSDVERGLVGHVLAMLDPDPSRRPEAASSWAQFLAQSTLSEPVGQTADLGSAPTRVQPTASGGPTGQPPFLPPADDTEPRRRRWPWLAAVVLVLAGIGGAMALSDRSDAGDAVDATSGESAEEFTAAVGDTTSTTEAVDEDEAEPTRPPMPDFVGERWTAAARELRAAGVEVDKVEELDDTERDGTVLRQSVRAGATSPDTVELVVARRPITSLLADQEPAEQGGTTRPDVTAETAQLNGVEYDKAVTVRHSICATDGRRAFVDYLASRDHERLIVNGGLADDAPAATVAIMEVFADGVLIDSQTVRVGEELILDVDVTDVLRIRLQSTLENWEALSGCGAGSIAVVWGDPRFVSAPPPLS